MSSDGDQCLLVAFGDLMLRDRQNIPSDRLFHLLMERNTWYLPRLSTYCSAGRRIVFYENGVGIRGYARISSVGASSMDDVRWLRGLGAEPFPVRVALEDKHVFKSAVDLRPLVDDLSFIRNKKFWGQSLRTTPRLLPAGDFELILSAEC